MVLTGTNLQYFDDDEPEGEPDISKIRGIVVEIEQRPPDEDASRESVSQESFEMKPVLQNKNGDDADQRQAAAQLIRRHGTLSAIDVLQPITVVKLPLLVKPLLSKRGKV